MNNRQLFHCFTCFTNGANTDLDISEVALKALLAWLL